MRRPAVRRAARTHCSDARHAAHAGAAVIRFCILSRKAGSCRCIAQFLRSKRHLLRVLTTKTTGTDRGRILLRESMPISCHEKTEKFFKVRPNRPKQAIRYPFDSLSIPDFRKIRSHFTSQYDALGPIPERIGRILAPMCGFTDKETDATTDFDPDFSARRPGGPRRSPQIVQKAGSRHPAVPAATTLPQEKESGADNEYET